MEKLKLQLIGIDGRDFRVYKTLLQAGPTSIRQIAIKTTVNRGSVYESLKRLVALGLVSYQRQSEKTRRYIAEPPSKLNDLISEREADLKTLQTNLKPHLKSLEYLESETFSLPSRIYEDDEGIAAILRDVLTTVEGLPEKQYRAISSETMRRYMYRKFPSYTKQRLAKQLFVKVLAVGGGGEITELSDRRWLPMAQKSNAQPLSYTLIYGSKLAIISITKMNVPHGIVIDDPAIATMQALLFDQLWETASRSAPTDA